ncbi:hypothetical protein RHGRI_037751 [Rhododendron griersonianum]|uniref:eIF-4F 25 kDa subunit n=1 Tax=Rhododendron griersonianum TaxID=479676 RepID=A0AAV6HWB8_9ERIC|nr:hypothetical protein RHGRI_037751 [Rhododendron griersonianum]
MVEEVGYSSAATEEPPTNSTSRAPIDDDDGGDAAEIVADDDTTALVAQPHPLEHSWTFWFDNPSAKSKQAAWGSSIRPVYTFSSVEEFWSLYNNIHRPSKLAVGADFHCFKHKIEPKWEDPVCANGGKWTVSFSRGKSDTGWLYTLLAMIGEQFDHGDEICGAVVNMSIGKQWKEFLDYNDSIGFIFHDDAKRLDRNAKNRYNV